MNSKLNFPTLLLILHLACNTMGQRKFVLVGCCTLMTSRSCPPARAHVTCLPGMECPKSYADQHTENKSHGFLRDPLPPQCSWWPAPTRPTLTPFHIHAPFPTSSPCSYLITEVLQFEYLGLILDPKLTMHLATTEAIRRAAHGQSVTQAVSYSLRYD